MLIIFFRAIILYIIILIVMRMMGKRQIGQLQPFEFAISIMIADLATIPMSEIGIPISNGIIPILGLLLMQLLISTVNLKSMKARQIICGKPRILINRGKIDEQALKKERFTINELQERLRGKDVNSIMDVEYAILETNGEISIVYKPNKREVRAEDLEIKAKYDGIQYDLVVDGKVMFDNLKILGKDYEWLKNKLQEFKIKPEQALVVTLDGKGEIFYQKLERYEKEIKKE